MNEYRYIQAEKKAGSMVISFVEQDLEGETLAECIRLEIDQLLQAESPDKLIVDFTNVRRIWDDMGFAPWSGRNGCRVSDS